MSKIVLEKLRVSDDANSLAIRADQKASKSAAAVNGQAGGRGRRKTPAQEKPEPAHSVQRRPKGWVIHRKAMGVVARILYAFDSFQGSFR